MKEFDFKRLEYFNFKILDEEYNGSGIYMMIFPNGMRYLGKSVHLNKRIRSHFRDFSFAKDWHKRARPTFTKVQLFTLPPIPSNPSFSYFFDVRTYAEKQHPDWKRLTKKRLEIAEKEYAPIYKEKVDEYERLCQERERKEELFTLERYKMACDFFNKVQLLIWGVSEDKITWAEDLCLNQITKENKREKYYNTVYPKQKEE